MANVEYEESIEIAAPAEAVFDYRADFTNLSAYNPNVSNVRNTGGVDGSAAGGGARLEAEFAFDLTLPGATEPLQTPLRVTGAERAQRLEYETGPGFMARGVNTFEARDGGTLLTFRYTLSFPGEIDDATVQALQDTGREQCRLELENIKKILEG